MTSGLGPIPGKNNQFQGEEFGGNQDKKCSSKLYMPHMSYTLIYIRNRSM
jgi:hypothetical protein